MFLTGLSGAIRCSLDDLRRIQRGFSEVCEGRRFYGISRSSMGFQAALRVSRACFGGLRESQLHFRWSQGNAGDSQENSNRFQANG